MPDKNNEMTSVELEIIGSLERRLYGSGWSSADADVIVSNVVTRYLAAFADRRLKFDPLNPDHIDMLRGYLMRTCTYEIVRYDKTLRSKRINFDLLGDIPADSDSPTEKELRVLYDGIDTLDLDKRHVIEIYFWGSRDLAEVRALTGFGEKKVKRLLGESLEELRRYIDSNESF